MPAAKLQPDCMDRSRPSWAASIWTDPQNIYLMLPKSGHVSKLPLTEGGLSKALKLLSPPSRASLRPPQPLPQPLPRPLPQNHHSVGSLGEACANEIADVVRRLKRGDFR